MTINHSKLVLDRQRLPVFNLIFPDINMAGISTPTSPHWPIDLSQRPVIAQGALTSHKRSGEPSTERYLLPDLWCLHLYRYHGRIEIPGHRLMIHPGSLTIFPAGLPLTYHFFGAATHFYVHFQLATSTKPPRHVPGHQDTGADNEWWNGELEQIVEFARSDCLRAEVKLWDLLFTLSSREQSRNSTQHPSLQKALRIIEIRLSEPLAPVEIAREVGLSHNHLNRLFHQETGSTISGYIRSRRAHRARHLLENTTLPLVNVAAQVGVEPGKGVCNLVKVETGRSPRKWRGHFLATTDSQQK
ncbi:MAG TPA: helix-turn-helix domain-containing protein, partial [Abditibacteriaceae bacterium]